jgi:hypothetical protein
VHRRFVHQSPRVNRFPNVLHRSTPPPTLTLDRRAFYELAEECRAYAAELANYDQHRVNLQQCHRFNAWLAHLKRYDRLQPRLATLSAARPIARWQVVALMMILWFFLALSLPGRVSQQLATVMMGSWLLSIVAVFFIPESVYGTTIELLEGKVLRVVDALLEILESGAMEFTEAAFFKARENLLAARTELRQQIDLAHRPPNGPIL